MQSSQGISLPIPTWEGTKTAAYHVIKERVAPLASKVWNAVSNFFIAIFSFLGRALSGAFSFVANTGLGRHIANHSTAYKATALIGLALLAVGGAMYYVEEKQPKDADLADPADPAGRARNQSL